MTQEAEGRPRRTPPYGWLLAILVFAVIAWALVGAVLSRMMVLAAPEQPVAFSHEIHADAAMECLFCHPSPLRSAVAGIPSVERCMGCHEVISTESSEVQVVAGHWEREEPILWTPVNRQPDFVYFSHQPHLLAGESCETCHGEVASMTRTRPAVKMDMGWCLDCHLKQPEHEVARLTDCLTCHK